MLEDIILKIRITEWSNYSGSPWYKPEEVVIALERLANLKKKDQAENVGHVVLSAIGNNHAGTYYPAIETALDIIIAIAEQEENTISKQCALGVLYDLTCFEVDLEGYTKTTKEKLETWVRLKLAPYEL
jgi:phosphopentomutase